MQKTGVVVPVLLGGCCILYWSISPLALGAMVEGLHFPSMRGWPSPARRLSDLVAAVIEFESEDEAVRLANATEYGLAAYAFTRDSARVLRLSEALEAGMVGINIGVIGTEVAPFGGIKQSGIGREGSRHGMEEFLELKYVLVGGLCPA
jgi:succinate-semialdehyde dehydrogenase / glutarate-semialdehyde dehydrogenase